jgi:hypothetical protein
LTDQNQTGTNRLATVRRTFFLANIFYQNPVFIVKNPGFIGRTVIFRKKVNRNDSIFTIRVIGVSIMTSIEFAFKRFKVNYNIKRLNIALLRKHTLKGPSSVLHGITLSILDRSKPNRYQSTSDSQANIFSSKHFLLRPCLPGAKPWFYRTDLFFSQESQTKSLDF